MLDYNTTYGAVAAPITANYPQGEPNNSTSPGAFNGFPLEEAWLKDALGFFQALVLFTGITPSGSAEHANTSDLLDALKIMAIPVGSIIEYGGVVVPNAFWKFCDYETISQTTYADLFTALAHRYAKTLADKNAAEGSTLFHLPDYRDLYLRGGLRETFANTDITIGTERITITGHSFTRDGTPVRFFSSGTLPAVITALTNQSWETLYVRVIDANTIELYDTEANAIDTSGTTGIINFADQGTGTHELTQQGIIETDALQGHVQGLPGDTTLYQMAGGSGPLGTSANGASATRTATETGTPTTDSINGTPRVTNETRPATGFARKIIKIT